MTIDLPANAPTSDEVLAEITRLIGELLDEYSLDDVEVTRETLFQDDLELESIDLVSLGGQLRESYGERINFAEFIGSMDLDEIINMRVGQLVDYVTDRLATTSSEGAA
ncbi:putative acyl carrier protein [Renibacterium salmoninarum ATCC 33209]|uniref:Putative acyl carrier protein n=1 Tax=Renibacterium salmoninarum (strain ATCC 33209 / DSM 20767 / JCM 11484 / NBRC 15589 / NCIMB 2235) TaxID=288705 RepID=A9WRI5_RENSM|nr:phosphopantetheine-binding protein [Renibacterium salmoninarum]ABY24267.1 putative acyl carrier protein [Renibacterium salmoninarum ATCC 33209]